MHSIKYTTFGGIVELSVQIVSHSDDGSKPVCTEKDILGLAARHFASLSSYDLGDEILFERLEWSYGLMTAELSVQYLPANGSPTDTRTPSLTLLQRLSAIQHDVIELIRDRELEQALTEALRYGMFTHGVLVIRIQNNTPPSGFVGWLARLFGRPYFPYDPARFGSRPSTQDDHKG